MSNYSQSNSRHRILVIFHSQSFCLHSEMDGKQGGSGFPSVLEVWFKKGRTRVGIRDFQLLYKRSVGGSGMIHRFDYRKVVVCTGFSL